MVRDDNDRVEDGADEKMLSGGEGRKDLEIKFISGTPTNGDAQIDIGDIQKAVLTGLTKEELMRYASDPFWIKLRWFLFIGFWALWVGMLVGAIFIIIQTPKCLPPEPHTWYKQGPLVEIDSLEEPSEAILKELKEYGTHAVVFKLPADETYSLKNLDEIKKITAAYGDVKVVLDVTATYVLEGDALFQEALQNQSVREAFVFTDASPPNWVSFEGTPAFKEITPGLSVLSQYGNGRFDLRMDNALVKEKFKAVLAQLAESGVRGVRLDKSRHFLIDTELTNESPDSEVTSDVQNNEYAFWTHSHSSLRDGLGPLLAEYRDYFRNLTNNEGFLSTVDDIVRPEVYKTDDGVLGVDIPRFGRLDYLLDQQPLPLEQVKKELEEGDQRIRALRSWPQFPYSTVNFQTLGASEYTIFTFLLPGVPVTDLDALTAGGRATVLELEKTRESPSLMHGSLEVHTDNSTLAYSR